MKRSDWFTLAISVLSLLLAAFSLLTSMRKDSGEELAKATRDWQKGFFFSKLLASPRGMTIDQLTKEYISGAANVREKYNLKDKDFSKEEVFSIVLEMINTGAIRMPDSNTFTVRTDDDETTDRRLVFDMLQFAEANEFKYSSSQFPLEFLAWYQKERQLTITKDKAFSVFALAMQGAMLAVMPKPSDPYKCLGEVKEMFVATVIAARTTSPAIMLPLPPCPVRR